MTMRKILLFTIFAVIPSLLIAQTLQKVRVTPQWTPQSQFAGIYMAYEKGFYKEAGLDVEIIHPSVSMSSVYLLTSGRTDIITSQLIEALLSYDTGIDIVNFLQTSQHNSLMIVSHQPLNGIKSLNKMKIGRWAAGFSELGIAMAIEHDLKVEWIQYLNNIALYISGAIDATLCMEYNEYFQLVMSGADIGDNQKIFLRDLGYDVPEDGFYALRSYYLKNKDVLKKFADATKKGWEWVRNPDNKEETIDYVMKLVKENNIPTNRVNQEYMLDVILKLQETDGKDPYTITKDRFDFAVNLLLRNNFMLNSAKFEDFVVNL